MVWRVSSPPSPNLSVSPIRIEPGGPTDKAFVVSLGRAAFDAFGDYGATLKRLWARQRALIARRADRAVGFALTSAGPNVHVSAVAVASEARGMGVGRALLKAALQGAEWASAEIAESNTAARRLFEAVGFRHERHADAGRYANGAKAQSWIWRPNGLAPSRDIQRECK